MVRNALALVGFLVVCGIAAFFVHAQMVDDDYASRPQRLAVSMADLDLSYREDRIVLKRRVRDAARAICDYPRRSFSFVEQAAARTCYHRALVSARPQMKAAIRAARDRADAAQSLGDGDPVS